MSDTELADLRTWATAHAPAGCLRARQCLELLDLDLLRRLELADADDWLAELRARLDAIGRPFTPVPHPCS
jgi:hypothetical protein